MTSYMISKYEIKRDRERRQRRKNAKFMRIVKKLLLAEMAGIGFEGLYRFGSLIRGYDSFGGESLALVALAGLIAWQIYRSAK